MSKPETISLYQFFRRFPDGESARLYLESKRWPEGVCCAYCGSNQVSECKGHKPMAYRCKTCRKHFSVRTGTVLAESKIPLHKWLMAIYMMTTARKGVPSTQLSRELGITQKSAWFLAHRIREAWLSVKKDLGNVVEVDETYIGGKERNKHANKKLHAGRGGVGKQAVVGALERGGEIIAKPIADTKAPTLQGFITNNVQAGSTVCTDSHKSYTGLRGYKHHSVSHSSGEYVRNAIHTNGIESFWSLLKRGHYGIYHHMSDEHVHRYVDEFSFRHDTAEVGTMKFIDVTVCRMEGKRLKYEQLIGTSDHA